MAYRAWEREQLSPENDLARLRYLRSECMVAVHEQEPVPWPMGGTAGYLRRWAFPMLGYFPGTEGERR